MVEFLKQASRWGFGEQASRGSAAATKTKWLGTQHADWTPPSLENTIRDYRGGAGGRDAYQQQALEAKMAGNLSVVVQNAYAFLWALGSETIVAGNGTNGAPNGSYIRQLRGGNTPKLVTLHQVLGDSAGAEYAIDWLDCMVDKLNVKVEENAELTSDIDYLAGGYADDATPVSVAAQTTAPYLWNTATWGILNTGSTLATHTNLTGLTQPTALQKWDYSLTNTLREIRGHRSTNGHLPITTVQGKRVHDLNATVVPADKTLWQKLVRDRTKFDLYYRLTRASNDFIEFRWLDCYTKKGPHGFPMEEQEIPVDLAIQPRVVEIDVIGSANQSVLADA